MSIMQSVDKALNSLLMQFGFEIHHSDNLKIKKEMSEKEIERLKHGLESVAMQGALSRITSKND